MFAWGREAYIYLSLLDRNLIMRIVFLLLFSFFVLSCAHVRKSIPVEFGDRQVLFFTGKGAAAGIMMDALLGGAGVAIGVAIDEGIAKDIYKTIQEENPQFDVRRDVEVLLINGKVKTSDWQKLTIDRYGFQVVDADFVVPVLEFTVSCINASKKSFSLEKDSMSAYKVELALVKNNGKAARQLLYKGVTHLFHSAQINAYCN